MIAYAWEERFGVFTSAQLGLQNSWALRRHLVTRVSELKWSGEYWWFVIVMWRCQATYENICFMFAGILRFVCWTQRCLLWKGPGGTHWNLLLYCKFNGLLCAGTKNGGGRACLQTSRIWCLHPARGSVACLPEKWKGAFSLLKFLKLAPGAINLITWL